MVMIQAFLLFLSNYDASSANSITGFKMASIGKNLILHGLQNTSYRSWNPIARGDLLFPGITFPLASKNISFVAANGAFSR
jgi:hypothetical protein